MGTVDRQKTGAARSRSRLTRVRPRALDSHCLAHLKNALSFKAGSPLPTVNHGDDLK